VRSTSCLVRLYRLVGVLGCDASDRAGRQHGASVPAGHAWINRLPESVRRVHDDGIDVGRWSVGGHSRLRRRVREAVSQTVS
jgi:hypothetical protein